MPDPAKEIRTAIERGDFTRAGALWQDWTAGALSPEEWAQAKELYPSIRRALVAEKAHLLYNQNNLHAANAYLTAAK